MSQKLSRRELFLNTAAGVGGAATLSMLLPGGGLLATPALGAELIDPLAPKQPHFPAKVKSVVWLHQFGAPSSLDLYDYKPELIKRSGQEVPASFLKGVKTSTQGGLGKLITFNREWKQYGQSGAWFSDLVPNIANHADKIAFIKASTTIGATHDISVLKLNTGDLRPGRPSLGAWVTYALGSANRDLPAYVVLYSGKREPPAGSVNWSSGFLPAVYQGTAFRPGGSPILNLSRPDGIREDQQRDDLNLLNRLNQLSAERHPENTEFQARLNSYELAYRMESAAPEAVDLSKESDATRDRYGLNEEITRDYGTAILRARRLVEHGVRFVHVVSGPIEGAGRGEDRNWDAHENLPLNHGLNAKAVDKPIDALLSDLTARGLLDSTLVVWTSEFGRTPWGQSGDGRDHNPWGYTQWLAGGGVKAGSTYGETDELGVQSVGKAVDTYDLHATVLQLLGLDHLKVTFLNHGRSERPTVVYGEVVKELLA